LFITFIEIIVCLQSKSLITIFVKKIIIHKLYIMALPNIFQESVSTAVISRIEKLTTQTTANWGKMNVSQMLAHCNVAFEMVFTTKHKKPNTFIRFILKTFVKSKVVSEKPFGQNSRTAPEFIVVSDKDFAVEKVRLINHIKQIQELGESHFDNKESHSFGQLSKTEWNNLFYKHLDHHLIQFGV
jgi:hypothetical protein